MQKRLFTLESSVRYGTVALSLGLLLAVGGCNSSGSNPDSDAIHVVKDAKPEGAVAIGKEEMATKQGVPLYPGAEAPEGQSSVTMGVTEGRYTLVLVTPDPLPKVVSFYKSKIPVLNGGMNNGNAEFLGSSANKSSVALTISSKDKKTTIRLSAVVETAPKKP